MDEIIQFADGGNEQVEQIWMKVHSMLVGNFIKWKKFG